jgi:hypothetical protein
VDTAIFQVKAKLRKPLNYLSLKPAYVYQTVFYRENRATPGVKTGLSDSLFYFSSSLMPALPGSA